MKHCTYCGYDNEESASRCAGCGNDWPAPITAPPVDPGNAQKLAYRVGGIVVCLLALSLAAHLFLAMARTSKLLANGTNTTGAIIYQHVGMHGIVDSRYRFSVGVKEYEGRSSGRVKLEKGSPVQVFYCRSDPRLSALGEPSPPEMSNWVGALVPTLIAGMAFCFAMGWIHPGTTLYPGEDKGPG